MVASSYGPMEVSRCSVCVAVSTRAVWHNGAAYPRKMVWTVPRPAGSFRCAVTLPEEVRPVNVVSMWVLPSSSRIGH